TRAEQAARDVRLLAEQAARHERLLADLRDVHDRAENVRLMVSAHRSGKAYDEHMQALIGCQVLLLKVKRTLDVSEAGGAGKDTDDQLKEMLGYLRALQDESRCRYRRVTDLQLFDDAVTTQRFAGAAAMSADEPPESSRLAWKFLKERSQFPVLYDLTNE